MRTRALEELNQRLSKQEADQPAAKTASWSKFSAGSRVSLTGLVARPELNGQLGHIIQYIPARQRYRIELKGEVVSIKKQNMLPCGPAEAQSIEDLKCSARERGNVAFRAGNYEKAVEEFTVALLHDSGDHAIYSNRSAAYLSFTIIIQHCKTHSKAPRFVLASARGGGV